MDNGMMFFSIIKIVSGGQTGVDQAALDSAIKFGIPHGGWIPKGRPTEKGPLPDKYKLTEMSTRSYARRTEQNVVDSDGTLIIARGKLTGGTALTRDFAHKHSRPLLYIDLDKTAGYMTGAMINAWINKNLIRILNVAGPRASKDPEIYSETCKILEGALYLMLVKKEIGDIETIKPPNTEVPHTVEEAVTRLRSDLPLKDQSAIAKMDKDQLFELHFSLGVNIRNDFGLWSKGSPLLEDCRLIAGEQISPDGASLHIIEQLWQVLQKEVKLRSLNQSIRKQNN